MNCLNRAGLPYHSPHKFRHGLAVYALMRSKDISKLKAVSQNLMHSNISITDGIYGILSDNDVKEQIASLGNKEDDLDSESLHELVELNKKILKELEERDN